MDHKAFFQDFGKFTLRDVDSEYTLEQLYQAFKQRLIEEVVTIGPDLAIIRLIDTTSGGVKKYAGEALDRLIDTTERENG